MGKFLIMKKALGNIRILDFSQYISGPWGSMILAEFGADVIKIEPIKTGESFRIRLMEDPELEPLFHLINHDKKSMTLNIAKPEGQEIVRKLVLKSDVVLENFVPGITDKFGIGYNELKKLNPGIVYCAVSGYGQTGIEEWVKKPSFDLIAQAQSGILDIYNLYEQHPPLAIADISTASYAVICILIALNYKNMTGKGQFIDLSMLDLMYTLNLRTNIIQYVPKERYENPRPTYRTWKAEDGYIAIAVSTHRQWNNFCKAIEREDLTDDSRFDFPYKRWQNRDILNPIVAEWFQSKTLSEIEQIMFDAHIPCGRVRKKEEIHNHPQLKARGMPMTRFKFEGFGRIYMPDVFVKFSETPGSIERMAPKLGEHTDEILQEVAGLKMAEIKALREKEVI